MDADKEPLPALPGCPAGGSPAAVLPEAPPAASQPPEGEEKAPAEADASLEDDGPRQCRICFDSDEPETLVRACLCNAWVHLDCLNQWRQGRYPKARRECNVCRARWTTAAPRREMFARRGPRRATAPRPRRTSTSRPCGEGEGDDERAAQRERAEAEAEAAAAARPAPRPSLVRRRRGRRGRRAAAAPELAPVPARRRRAPPAPAARRRPRAAPDAAAPDAAAESESESDDDSDDSDGDVRREPAALRPRRRKLRRRGVKTTLFSGGPVYRNEPLGLLMLWRPEGSDDAGPDAAALPSATSCPGGPATEAGGPSRAFVGAVPSCARSGTCTGRRGARRRSRGAASPCGARTSSWPR
ncbi:hypothetical protein JL720_5132 [Aureococcus anophagefferens]|nr:hypothetical protein JL720_5132 [Aureococcus anophagefferens]